MLSFSTTTFRPFAIACLAFCLCMGSWTRATADEEKPQVDLLLALGVDISYSMDEEEQHLQRGGYLDALISKPVLDGVAAGIHGKIAITYYEWAGTGERRTIMPWTVIDGLPAAQAFVDKLRTQPYRRASRTSVSGAIDYGVAALDEAPFSAPRRVIDISGDGPNNHGRPVELAREEALSKNIVINGLPIIFQRRFNSAFDIDNLDEYYADCVVGGFGSFTIAIANQDQFTSATRQKLLREIAALDERPLIIRIADRPKTDCMVGEKMWLRRFGND